MQRAPFDTGGIDLNHQTADGAGIGAGGFQLFPHLLMSGALTAGERFEACPHLVVNGLPRNGLLRRRSPASVILFHNHPSGDPSPSPQDLSFTAKLSGIGEALGVEVLDHLIVTTSSFLSFKQRALL